jgi:hypothetical protein
MKKTNKLTRKAKKQLRKMGCPARRGRNRYRAIVEMQRIVRLLSNDSRAVEWGIVANKPKVDSVELTDHSDVTEFPTDPLVLSAPKGPTNVDQN